jgi:hypothetical protein
MPPQQGYALLDFVDEIFRLGAHGGSPFIHLKVGNRRGT